MRTKNFPQQDTKILDWIEKKRIQYGSKVIQEKDSFVEVFPFENDLIGLFTESADGHGFVWLYLIMGTEGALLIDTGFGIGDLKALVEFLAGSRKITVCNSQAHFCRSTGNCQFDRVYCHEYALPTLEAMKNPHVWDRLFDENGDGRWIVSKREDVVDYKDYEACSIQDGHRFDLGGRDVECLWLPGNAQGGLCFLDRKSRTLIAPSIAPGRIPVGVAPRVQREAFREYATVAAFRDGLKRLKTHDYEFDTLLTGADMCIMPKDFLDDLYELCESIIANPADYDDRIIHGDDHTKNVEILLKKGKYAEIAYNTWSVMGC